METSDITTYGVDLCKRIRETQFVNGIQLTMVIMLPDAVDPGECYLFGVAPDDKPDEEAVLDYYLQCFKALAVALVQITEKPTILNAVSEAFAIAENVQAVEEDAILGITNMTPN